MEDDIIIILVVRPSRKSRKGLSYEQWRITLAPDVLKAEASQRLPLCPRDTFAIMNVSSLSVYRFLMSVFLMPTGSHDQMT